MYHQVLGTMGRKNLGLNDLSFDMVSSHASVAETQTIWGGGKNDSLKISYHQQKCCSKEQELLFSNTSVFCPVQHMTLVEPPWITRTLLFSPTKRIMIKALSHPQIDYMLDFRLYWSRDLKDIWLLWKGWLTLTCWITGPRGMSASLLPQAPFESFYLLGCTTPYRPLLAGHELPTTAMISQP